MKSNRGVTLVSLLTYIAILLTVMVIIGRITGVFNKNLDSIGNSNDASTDYSLLNYCISAETKKASTTAEVGNMQGGGTTDYTFLATDSLQGSAIKFGDNNVICCINQRVYFNKTKIADNVTNFSITYIEAESTSQADSIKVSATIGNQVLEQEYIFR